MVSFRKVLKHFLTVMVMFNFTCYFLLMVALGFILFYHLCSFRPLKMHLPSRKMSALLGITLKMHLPSQKMSALLGITLKMHLPSHKMSALLGITLKLHLPSHKMSALLGITLKMHLPSHKMSALGTHKVPQPTPRMSPLTEHRYVLLCKNNLNVLFTCTPASRASIKQVPGATLLGIPKSFWSQLQCP